MQTKNYTTDLLPYIKALCGVEFASIELPRIKSLINSRAKRAYRASNYWPRFFKVGESRTVTSGVVLYDQTGLDSIDTFLRIHRTAPFASASAQEFDFYVGSTGATLIAGSLDPSVAFVTYKKQWTDVYGDGSSGTTILVPDEWFEYLVHGVYADYMRAEGQQEKAALADQEANEKLQDELIRLDEQRIASVTLNKISTNANMQSRY